MMSFDLSQHAQVRAKQRGISRECVLLISRLADRRTRVSGLAHALSISDRGRDRCIASGLPPAKMERARGVVVIADLAAARIITVEHRLGRRRLIRR
jgi:hypothetical protein